MGDGPLHQGETWVWMGGETGTTRRGCVWGVPAKQVSCGEWGAERPGCAQEARAVPSGLRAQLEPNKAGLGCRGLESPINGAEPSLCIGPQDWGFQRNNSELGVKDVKAAPQTCN